MLKRVPSLETPSRVRKVRFCSIKDIAILFSNELFVYPFSLRICDVLACFFPGFRDEKSCPDKIQGLLRQGEAQD